MYPILFTVGGFDIRASVVFLILAGAAGIWVGRKETERVGLDKRDFYLYWVVAAPFAFLVGSLNSLIFNVGIRDAPANLKYVLSSGLVSFGVVLAILLVRYVWSKLRGDHPGKPLDTIALTLPLILGIYRIGCFLNGCCYGKATDDPFGIYLPDVFGNWAYRYPTQLALMLFDFALFAWLWSRREKKPFEGSLTLSFLIVFSIGRLLIDGLRNLPLALGPFSLNQLSSITILLIIIYIAIELRLEKKTENA